MLSTLSWMSYIKIQYSSFLLFPVAYPSRIATHYNIASSESNCKVNDVEFPSGCKAHIITLYNKNMKIGIVTGGTIVRFTAISQYPKHEIKIIYSRDKEICWYVISSNLLAKLDFSMQTCPNLFQLKSKHGNYIDVHVFEVYW